LQETLPNLIFTEARLLSKNQIGVLRSDDALYTGPSNFRNMQPLAKAAQDKSAWCTTSV